MKRTLVFLLVLAAFPLCIYGCREAEGWESLKNSVKENIYIGYEIDKVESCEEAAVYLADWFYPDEETLKERLLKMDIVEEGINAFGKYFYTGEGARGESLCFYDGGEAFGSNLGIYGFAYMAQIDDNVYDLNLAYHPDIAARRVNNPLSEEGEFSQNGDLGFRPLEEMVASMEALLSELDVPETCFRHYFVIDGGTMTEGGAYLLYFTQVVDGIPLADHDWVNEGIQHSNTSTEVHALVSEAGLLDLRVRQTVVPLLREEELSLLSPEEAQGIMLDYYGVIAPFTNIYVENMELCYVTAKSNEGLRLIPAWVFCVAVDREAIGLDTAGEMLEMQLYKYEHFVIHAGSGEMILNTEDKGVRAL